MTRRHIVTGALVAAGWLAWAPAARADSVLLKNGLLYQPTKVMTAKGGVVSFRLASGVTKHVPLAKVAKLEIKGDADFNQAETHLKAGEHAKAVQAYNRAERRVTTAWKKDLIRYRLLSAAEAAGKIEAAVKRWLEIVDAAKGAKGVLALRPRRMPEAGSAGNDRAINLLTAKAGLVKSKAYLTAIRQMLLDLYERQGRRDQARAMAALLAGQAKVPPVTQPGNNEDQPVRPKGSTKANLRMAKLSLQAGRYEEVPPRLEPLLKEFSLAELPEALYLLGTAQAELAGKQTDPAKARPLLLKGGLNLMRVAVFFTGSEHVPNALLRVGRINEGLKNPDGARAAYSELVKRHSKTPAAKKAAEALKRLGGKAD